MDLTANSDDFGIAVQTVQTSEPCAICTNHITGSMLTFRERPEQSIAPFAHQRWLLCAECGAAVVAELERAALHTPLRLRIALAMIATEKRAPQRLTPFARDYWRGLSRKKDVSIGFAVALFGMAPLTFVLILVLTASGVIHL